MFPGPSVRDKTIPVDTSEGRQAIGQQLERVLTSSVFKSSKRYPALLKYVVQQTLEGRESTLKERILGIEVFQRPPDYDTSADHVVRTAAGEVRKRLAQYYMEPGREQELRIELPPGSYIPQFRPAPEPTFPSLVPEISNTLVATGWKRYVRLILIVSAILNVAFVFYFAERNNLGVMARGETTMQKFWVPVMRSGTPVLICVGTRDGGFFGGRGGGQVALPGPQQPVQQLGQAAGDLTNQDPLLHRVGMADVLTLARVSAYVGSQRVPYRILNPVSTTLTDLRNGPTVLIGAGNNNWARQLTDGLRFSFTTADPNAPDNVRPLAIRDSQHPENHNWVTAEGQQSTQTTVYREYGLITRLMNQRVEQVIVVIGGLGPHATDAAGEFLTDPIQLKKLDAFTPVGWSGKNVQIVLSAEVVRGKTGPPKVEAAWFW